MPALPFFVCTKPRSGDCNPKRLIFVAYEDTPEMAVAAVRTLVADGTELAATGETLSLIAARALGLRPGHARLV